MARLAALPDTDAGAPRAPHGTASPPQRTRGRAELAFREHAGATRVSVLYQEGSAKIRLPSPEPGGSPEAILINTAGGLTGGDRLSLGVRLEPTSRATVTTQAAERIYRAAGTEPARVEVSHAVGDRARLDWLPQETILFDRSALSRTLTIDLAADATFLGVESFVFGRSAMGETVHALSLRDSWRVRRHGRLVFADRFHLDGDASSILGGPATGRGAVATVTLLYVGADAEGLLETVRGTLAASPGESGASAWNGMLVARFLAPTGQSLRTAVIAAVSVLRSGPLPRIWMC
jgi:urease accessory protein